MEYHSALKIIELSSFERIWKNPKCLFLRERRQSEMATLYNSNCTTYGKGKTMETVKGSGVAQGWREGKWQPTPEFFLGKSHGQRRLAGCSPWGLKEPDTTE